MSKSTELVAEIEAPAMEVAVRAPSGLPDVNHLMEMALGQGEGGVAALERLVGLQEHVMRVQAENDLSAALGEFQADCPAIKQERTAKIATKGGGGYSFTYAPLDVVARTIRPHLKAHGLSYSFDSELNGNMMTVTCTVRHRHGASVSGSYTATTDSSSGASAAQKGGMAHTYAKRQALADALGLITTNADVDESPVAAETLTDEQMGAIRKMLKAADTSIDQILHFAKAASLDTVGQDKYDSIVGTLAAKIAKASA